MKSIENRLISSNIKPTPMRELVLKILSEQESAMSLSDINALFDKADKVTLYRTLKTFEKHKLIHSIDDGTGSVKYALCKISCQCSAEDLHVHFVCSQCQHTYCLNDVAVPNIHLPNGFKLDSINMVVKGVCANCQK